MGFWYIGVPIYPWQIIQRAADFWLILGITSAHYGRYRTVFITVIGYRLIFRQATQLSRDYRAFLVHGFRAVKRERRDVQYRRHALRVRTGQLDFFSDLFRYVRA